MCTLYFYLYCRAAAVLDSITGGWFILYAFIAQSNYIIFVATIY